LSILSKPKGNGKLVVLRRR